MRHIIQGRGNGIRIVKQLRTTFLKATVGAKAKALKKRKTPEGQRCGTGSGLEPTEAQGNQIFKVQSQASKKERVSQPCTNRHADRYYQSFFLGTSKCRYLLN